MLKNMTKIAVSRSVVQFILAAIMTSTFGSKLVTLLAEVAGIDVTDPAVQAWIVNVSSAFLLGVVVYAVNKLGKRFAWVNQIFSLGMAKTGPAYVPNAEEAVVLKANNGAADTVRAA